MKVRVLGNRRKDPDEFWMLSRWRNPADRAAAGGDAHAGHPLAGTRDHRPGDGGADIDHGRQARRERGDRCPRKTLVDALKQRMTLHSTDRLTAKRDFVELAVDLTKRGGFVEV